MSTSSQTARASPQSLPKSPYVCPRGPILVGSGPVIEGVDPPMPCGDAVESPIGIEPMTYSLPGSYIPEERSTGWHLPCQPRKLSRVSMPRSKSCMPKIRPREPRPSSGRAPRKGTTDPSFMGARGPAIWRSV
jgi:hypothetical protein